MGDYGSTSEEDWIKIEMNTKGNLIHDRIYKTGVVHEVVSPVTGKPIVRVSLATKEEITGEILRLSKASKSPSHHEVLEFLHRLKDQILLHQDLLLEKTILETGFIIKDSKEIVNSAIEYLDDFEAYATEGPPADRVIRHSYSGNSYRNIRITHRPFRCIAAVVPQNASLSLCIIIIASALYSGSKVILRPSLQCASTGAILSEIVRKSHPPESCIAIINSLANEFLEACYASDDIDLIHYIGSNRYAESVLTRSFNTGKVCLLDGQGNGMLYIDDTFPVEDAIPIITSGATRYNGETCTSVNGVLIKDTVYDDLKDNLAESFGNLRVGNPMDLDSQIGPLFSEKQAIILQKTFLDRPDATIICGGDIKGAYFTPALIEGVNIHDPVVQEGFFGPALWIKPVREENLLDWLKVNRFPLSNTILSNNSDLIRTFAINSRAARICVNEDPSVESMFEPWGGYPPSGSNPVSVWTEKYQQTFQLDGKLKKIITINR